MYSLMPFTALGMTTEGDRQLTCSFKCCKTSFPVADMSAPDSRRTFNALEPLTKVIHTLTKGAHLVVTL